MSIGIGNKIIAGKTKAIPHYIGELFQAPYEDYVPDGAVLADGSEFLKDTFPTLWNEWFGKITEGKIIWYAFTNKFGDYYSKTEHPELNPYESLYRKASDGSFEVTDNWDEVVGMSGDTPVRNSSLDVKGITIKKGRLQTVTYEQYQNEINTKGYCKKFAVDFVNNKFKVPYAKGELTGELAKVRGNGKTLGLTDGTHYSAPATAGDNKRLYTVTGFYDKQVGIKYAGDHLPADLGIGVTQEADKSGMVAELQRDNDSKWYVQLANGAVPGSIADWNNYILTLQNKADKDLNNTIPSTNFIARSIGWIIPDYTKGYTVDSGYISDKFALCIINLRLTDGGTSWIKINDIQIYSADWGASYFRGTESVPLYIKPSDKVEAYGRSGQTITIYPLGQVELQSGGAVPEVEQKSIPGETEVK